MVKILCLSKTVFRRYWFKGTGRGNIWFCPGQTVKEFEEVAYKLDAGQVSEPVKTTYGYHIIKVTDKKN